MKSILDTDLYLFSTSYFFMSRYPEARCSFKFVDRNKVKRTPGFLEEFKKRLKDLENLALTKEERDWCVESFHYIPAFYWDWLMSFRIKPEKINVWLDVSGVLQAKTDRDCYNYESFLYEIYFLATLSELTHEFAGETYDEKQQIENINKKIALSNEKELKFADMGTRRRFSYSLHELIVGECVKNAKYFTGTSNVYLAKKFGVKAIGTMNHATISFEAAAHGYIHAYKYLMEDWSKVFGGYLGIVLTDCFTNGLFFSELTKEYASQFDGPRHDSGDPFEYVDMVVKRYKELGVNPLSKTIVFSDGLNMELFAKISDYCKGKINCSAGIGTNLVCDVPGVKAESIVWKIWETSISLCSRWQYTVKLSNNPEKATGEREEVEVCKEIVKNYMK